MFRLSHLQSTLHLMQYTYWDVFSYCSKQVFNLLILMPFSASAIFVSSLTHRQHVFLWGLFHLGRQKKVACGEIGWIGRVGHRLPFLVKNCWTLRAVWAGQLVNPPSWYRQTCWKSLQKNSLTPNAASHNNASWCTDTDGLLEHSPSEGSLYYKGPTLQKIILVFF